MRREILSLMQIALLLVLFNCSSDSEPEPQLTEEEKQMNKVAKTWTLGTVTYGGDDVTHRFDDFALTFTKNHTYTATGNLGDYDREPFSASGTWDFADNDLNVINRNDGVEMSLHVSDDEMVLSFTISQSTGRISGLGSYRFELVVQ